MNTVTEPMKGFRGQTFNMFLDYLQAEMDMPMKIRKQVEELLEDTNYYYINGHVVNMYGVNGKGVSVVYTNCYSGDPEESACLEHMAIDWHGEEGAVSPRGEVGRLL